MEHLKQFTASVGPLGQKLSERFGTLNQQAREHFGHVQDLTELPEEYKQLEQRVDALKNAHHNMMKCVQIRLTAEPSRHMRMSRMTTRMRCRSL